MLRGTSYCTIYQNFSVTSSGSELSSLMPAHKYIYFFRKLPRNTVHPKHADVIYLYHIITKVTYGVTAGCCCIKARNLG